MKFNNHPEDQTKIPGNSLAQEVTTKIIFCHSGIKRFGSDIYPMYVHTKNQAGHCQSFFRNGKNVASKVAM